MKREFLKELGLTDEQIDKVMSEYGKGISKEQAKTEDLTSKLEKANKDIKMYQEKVTSLESNVNDSAKVKEELETLKQQIADKEAKVRAEEQDKILTNNILEAIGEKKFVNDYTKNSIINEIKTALSDTNNAGKSAKDLFESITKDKTDIFENPNKMKDMADVQTNDIGDKNLNDMSTGIKLNPIFRKF